MADFYFSARLKNGQTQKGTIEAHNREAALVALRAKQLQPIIVKEVKAKGGLGMDIKIPGLSGVKPRAVVIFTRQFATMVGAGVPLMRTLTLLKDQSDSATFKKVLEEVITDVQGGGNLSDALSKHPKVFSPIYVNMVRAGETGGILDKVLNNLARQQEKDLALKGKIRAAMVYPSVIFTVTIIAFFVLMTFIVPKIGTILTSLSNGTAKLPIYTRVLLAVSHTMKQPVFILSVVVILPIVIILFRKYIKTRSGRYRWHSFLLKVPAVKVIITKTAVARFARIFGSLMGAGVSIISSIETTAGAMGNAVIEKELLDCSKAVQAGGQLSAELQKSKHFPPIVAQMLAVGEETGQMDTIIVKVAEFYEEEVDTAVGALSSIIEPVMIVLLGSIVGLIAISVFGPIAQLSTHVSG
jgi:type IV pilus assembly protein PilC